MNNRKCVTVLKSADLEHPIDLYDQKLAAIDMSESEPVVIFAGFEELLRLAGEVGNVEILQERLMAANEDERLETINGQGPFDSDESDV